MITPAMGELSFYLLDQGADGTPPLLGARELRRRSDFLQGRLAGLQAGKWLVGKCLGDDSKRPSGLGHLLRT